MRILSFVGFITANVMLLISCGGPAGNDGAKAPKTGADTLYDAVMDGHNEGMGKMGRLTRAEQTTRRLIDSIAKLPQKAQQAAAPLRVKLDSLQKELSYAEFAMNKWMDEINFDSAKTDLKKRIEYLESEKLKVNKVKDAINNSLQKADSLIRDKF